MPPPDTERAMDDGNVVSFPDGSNAAAELPDEISLEDSRAMLDVALRLATGALLGRQMDLAAAMSVVGL